MTPPVFSLLFWHHFARTHFRGQLEKTERKKQTLSHRIHMSLHVLTDWRVSLLNLHPCTLCVPSHAARTQDMKMTCWQKQASATFPMSKIWQVFDNGLLGGVRFEKVLIIALLDIVAALSFGVGLGFLYVCLFSYLFYFVVRVLVFSVLSLRVGHSCLVVVLIALGHSCSPSFW